MSVLHNHGDGTFDAHVDFPTSKSPDSLTAADLDGDGRPDLAVTLLDPDVVSVHRTTCLP